MSEEMDFKYITIEDLERIRKEVWNEAIYAASKCAFQIMKDFGDNPVVEEIVYGEIIENEILKLKK